MRAFLDTDAQRLGFVAAGTTHVGLVRAENEDHILARTDDRLWAVADGMGGHVRGAWASDTVCRALAAVPVGQGLANDCEAIADALADANEEIRVASQQAGSAIGTTVVALLIDGGRLACLWAGDSRLYRLRDGVLRRLMRDHSQVEELVESGIITDREARVHPLGNVVTRAVGAVPGLAIDVVEQDVEAGDMYLLCSDGLNKCLEDQEIGDLLGRHDPGAASEALIGLTLERGAPDNVSVIVVQAVAEAAC